MTIDRRTGRWAAGLLVVAVGALLLWYGLQGEGGDADMGDATAPAAGGDMIPPADEGVDHSVPPAQPDRTTTDVIPPDEP